MGVDEKPFSNLCLLRKAESISRAFYIKFRSDKKRGFDDNSRKEEKSKLFPVVLLGY